MLVNMLCKLELSVLLKNCYLKRKLDEKNVLIDWGVQTADTLNFKVCHLV